ncbi:hypothetical protein DXG03_002199 [Asterophora parasitica]|uniref:Uncharacterized protein n=1 Tax=Asterophora parasitica TaxID=117018 RepID=A0A9P7GGR3_9AGAR|nr:hypothetical protein DXG03_002199 [Asterophora parasitica]
MAFAHFGKAYWKLTLSLLEHSTTVDLLIAVIDTLRRFATIWACMDIMRTIVIALEKAHQVWKARGIQSRPLLSLLLEFDNGKHLSDASRDRITSDITVFTSALHPVTDCPDVVPDVLPEILLLSGDPAVDAPSLLANTLWIKYRKSVDWAWKVWDNTVASLRQVPVMTSDEAGRRACALRYGVLLWHVDQHLATGLDGEVLQWFLGPGKNEVAALGSEAWTVLVVVLLYLCVHGTLKTTTILQGLVYPAWQQAAANVAAGQKGPMLETFLRSANDICRLLLLSDDINDTVPPVDLLDLQCIRTRRQDVYCSPHFSLLASSIPLLICVENSEHISKELRTDSMSLRHLISRHRDFRQGAYRNLDAIREAFELSLQRLDEPSGALGKCIVTGLRTVLSDICEELSDWPAVTSLLSPWKIAATMVEMQLVLKQMGQELVRDPRNSAAHANLDQLILMLFHHSMTSEEAFYVGDMARGVDNVVAGKFINNGLKCITEIIQDSRSAVQNLSQGFQRAGELLRVLIYIAEPLREGPEPLPLVDTSIQDDFADALASKIHSMEHFATSNYAPEMVGGEESEYMVLILRLMQFELGFRTVWSSKMKEATEKAVSSLFRIAVACGASIDTNLIIYPLLIDTLYYIYDEIPVDLKATPYDPFHNYPDASVSDLPSELPVGCHKQLASLLPLHLTTASVSHMVNSHKDAVGNMIYGTAIVNRPWEWIENLGEPMAVDLTEADIEREEKERLESMYVVKNSASLSLDTFGTHITGEGVVKATHATEHRRKGSLQSFGDGLSAENLFKRDWRETRVESEVEATAGVASGRPKGETDQDAGGVFQTGPRTTTPRGSPSSMSRGSGSVRQSPQGTANRRSNSTISDVIDVDGITAAPSKRPLANKRKASLAVAVSDDEIEIIEGPVPSAAKKSRLKPLAKAKAKKQ